MRQKVLCLDILSQYSSKALLGVQHHLQEGSAVALSSLSSSMGVSRCQEYGLYLTTAHYRHIRNEPLIIVFCCE
jgi:hypothetical protein